MAQKSCQSRMIRLVRNDRQAIVTQTNLCLITKVLSFSTQPSGRSAAKDAAMCEKQWLLRLQFKPLRDEDIRNGQNPTLIYIIPSYYD